MQHCDSKCKLNLEMIFLLVLYLDVLALKYVCGLVPEIDHKAVVVKDYISTI